MQLAIVAPHVIGFPPAKGLRPARLTVASVRQGTRELGVGGALGRVTKAAVAEGEKRRGSGSGSAVALAHS